MIVPVRTGEQRGLHVLGPSLVASSPREWWRLAEVDQQRLSGAEDTSLGHQRLEEDASPATVARPAQLEDAVEVHRSPAQRVLPEQRKRAPALAGFGVAELGVEPEQRREMVRLRGGWIPEPAIPLRGGRGASSATIPWAPRWADAYE